MSKLSGNGPTNEYKTRVLPDGRYSSSWMLGALVVLILIVGGGYVYESRSMGGLTEHSTDAPKPAPSTPPAMAPAAPPASNKP